MTKFEQKEHCGEREDLPLYGILIPSPSFPKDPPGPCGAGIAEFGESRRHAEAELQQELYLLLVVFL